ncbi:4Fe4S-binding leucine-rich repeat protein [Methylocella sp.]|uniref:4Fe4S-binding leucine-rich repeat protein n=1 Tax=Methylocella sp. TaxID=1978226 RepID=UPI0037852363
MKTDIDEALDWLGEPVLCETCAHLERKGSRCQPLKACVHDRYARRVDRFFDWNADLAQGYLKHPYFEVRACAAKAADVFHLPPLLDDPEEAVRWSAARRLPNRFLLKLRADPHREVRIRVAQRLDGADLMPMIDDQDYLVRQHVARKLSPDLLVLMIGDPDVEVRRVVAARIAPEQLGRLASDPEAMVRLEAARRLEPAGLLRLCADPDWRVRHEIALRADLDVVRGLVDDEDPLVRDAARERLLGRACEPGRGAGAAAGFRVIAPSAWPAEPAPAAHRQDGRGQSQERPAAEESR